MTATNYYLPKGLPRPVPESDGLSSPYYEGLAKEEVRVQRCGACGCWQWGPEWICNRCHSFDMRWEAIEPRGRIYSWTRCWHPVHPALKDHGPYLVVLVEIPHADGIRMIGNLIGDPMQTFSIGDDVEAVFEHHADGDAKYTLLQWRAAVLHR